MLSEKEIERYSRQLPIIGLEGQQKLKKSTVVIVGVGGLGSAASYYLAASGIGKLILIDNGLVEESNLQRQILYTTNDIGKSKVEAAAERLRSLNPYIEITPVNEFFSENVAMKYFRDVDVVVDALDNWGGRLVIDKVAHKLGKPFIHAGVHGFYGQLTVIIPGKTPCLKCVFPKKPSHTVSPLPIIPTTPGVLGVLEANEALKILLGKGEILANKLLVYDGLTGMFEVLKLSMAPDCPVCSEYYEK
ncbi:HesA/MoeB/ThiF family protein [Staphylothermus hellenicus]|uniref:UBA/THIF-type NAD/FAD binding protein n=1 Tax=Staphylothermus hellenicus (strain DSM 12710 / JCM 10830 / BK20S6-10-b1 / P8) TaxID=591019 RepID=D7DAG5_STAHD|nr:HesA/MoeB/ThiF family protein [Staphylothermus hellenicus]ADI31162.1 UBA/THIF-type NAD/FAD binding protein [Staphylothermus hellenicus DSM 12710]